MSSTESHIKDISDHAHQTCGKLFSGDLTQIVKQNNDGNDVNLEHAFYTIDDDGTVKKMGSLNFVESLQSGTSYLDLNIANNSTGDLVSVLKISESGLVVNGAMDVSGGATSFESASFQVSDYDLTLGSEATSMDDVDGGGIILGNDTSGKKTILYSVDPNTWLVNAGISLDSGSGLTIGSVTLNESEIAVGSAPIKLGSNNEWRISMDSVTNNLLFEHYDSESQSYILKMELKSSS